jgi:hypothetical protein
MINDSLKNFISLQKSRCYIVPILVLKTVGAMHQVHRAFEAFDNLDQDLAQFI